LLFHRFEERRLRLGRRAVDLVREDDIGEHATGPELEVTGGAVPHRDARHVGGEEVGSELNAAPAPADRTCDGLGQRRLADAGNVLHEEVPLGEEAHECEMDRPPLAPDHGLDLMRERVEHLFERAVESALTGAPKRVIAHG
jgi:hypothetical protein